MLDDTASISLMWILLQVRMNLRTIKCMRCCYATFVCELISFRKVVQKRQRSTLQERHAWPTSPACPNHSCWSGHVFQLPTNRRPQQYCLMHPWGHWLQPPSWDTVSEQSQKIGIWGLLFYLSASHLSKWLLGMENRRLGDCSTPLPYAMLPDPVFCYLPSFLPPPFGNGATDNGH